MYRHPPVSLEAPPLLPFPSRTCRPSEQHLPRLDSASPTGAAFPEAGLLPIALFSPEGQEPACPGLPPPVHTPVLSVGPSPFVHGAHLQFQSVLSAQVSVKTEGEARVLPVLNRSRISFTWGVRRRGGARLIPRKARLKVTNATNAGQELKERIWNQSHLHKLNQDPHHQPLV